MENTKNYLRSFKNVSQLRKYLFKKSNAAYVLEPSIQSMNYRLVKNNIAVGNV